MPPIRLLQLSGSYYEMGYQHGKAHYDAIHKFTQERLELSQSEHWTGRNLSSEAVLALAEACVPAHQDYAPDLMQELQGMADATGLSLAELIVMNGFTDFIDTVYKVGDMSLEDAPAQATSHSADDCTAFLVPASRTSDGVAMYGQTWDMHATATPYVMLYEGKPDDVPPFMTFTITGCIGMIGMNAHGVVVGINNLMGADGQVGVTWNFVVRKILQQSNLDDALKCITEAPLAGAHNYLIMDKTGAGYNVEAMSSRVDITPLEEDAVVHTNHCIVPHNTTVERERTAESLTSSLKRLDSARKQLRTEQITPEMLMALTADESAICVRATPPMHVESCGGAIMRPQTGEFWAVWGLPSENEYERFVL
jgi:isopenicillin-N N-acyltransferase-like protein